MKILFDLILGIAAIATIGILLLAATRIYECRHWAMWRVWHGARVPLDVVLEFRSLGAGVPLTWCWSSAGTAHPSRSIPYISSVSVVRPETEYSLDTY